MQQKQLLLGNTPEGLLLAVLLSDVKCWQKSSIYRFLLRSHSHDACCTHHRTPTTPCACDRQTVHSMRFVQPKAI